MINEQSITTLYTKLAKIMGEVTHIPKRGYNDHFKYKFATEGDISDAIRALLSQNNIAVFASMTAHEQKASGNTIKTICTFEFTLACGDTGATHTCMWTAEANDNQDKGYNKAATAAMKYWLLKTFMIPTGDDPDGDGTPAPKGSKGVSANPKQRAQQQPAPAVSVGNPSPASEPAIDYAAKEAEQRRQAATALDNEAVTIFKVRYTPTHNGQGVEKWTATARVTDGATIPVIVFGEDANRITKAGYKWPKTDGDNLNVTVITELRNGERRIKDVLAPEGVSTPQTTGNANLTASDALPDWFNKPTKEVWGAFKVYILKNVYDNNPHHMNGSLKKHGVTSDLGQSLNLKWYEASAKATLDYLQTERAKEQQPEAVSA